MLCTVLVDSSGAAFISNYDLSTFPKSSVFTRAASICSGPAGVTVIMNGRPTIHELSATFSDMLNPHYTVLVYP